VASPFTITALTEKVTLDDEGVGVAVFTVSNGTGSDREIRASIEVDGPASGARLTIAGEEERPLSSTGSEQYVINVEAPPETTPGSYHFRLRISDERDPDDTFAVSPNVGFEVAAPEPEPEPAKPFPWWIVAVGVVVLIVGGVVAWLLLKPDSELTVLEPEHETEITVDDLINGVSFNWDGGPDEGFLLAAFVCRVDADGPLCPLVATSTTADRSQILSAGSFSCPECLPVPTVQQINDGLRACATEAGTDNDVDLVLQWGVVALPEGETSAQLGEDDVDTQVVLVNELAPAGIALGGGPIISISMPPSITAVTFPPIVVGPNITLFTIPPLFPPTRPTTTRPPATTAAPTTTTLPPSCDGAAIFVAAGS